MQEDFDLRYQVAEEKKFGMRAALILRHQDRIFVNVEPGTPAVAVLPGGAIKFGETGEQAVMREAKEELALTDFHPEFAGVMESFWQTESLTYHQPILIFRAEVTVEQAIALANLDYEKLDLPAGTQLNWQPLSKVENILQPRGIEAAAEMGTPMQHLLSYR